MSLQLPKSAINTQRISQLKLSGACNETECITMGNSIHNTVQLKVMCKLSVQSLGTILTPYAYYCTMHGYRTKHLLDHKLHKSAI